MQKIKYFGEFEVEETNKDLPIQIFGKDFNTLNEQNSKMEIYGLSFHL